MPKCAISIQKKLESKSGLAGTHSGDVFADKIAQVLEMHCTLILMTIGLLLTIIGLLDY